MNNMMRRTTTETIRHSPLLVRVGLSAVLLASIGGWILSLLLLVVATRFHSQLFGMAVLVALSVTSWWAAAKCFHWRSPRSGVIVFAIVLVVGLYALAAWCSPTGWVPPGSRLTSVYRGPNRFNRFSPAWLVDEADQVRLGGFLLPCLDPLMSREQGKRFAETFSAVYAELGHSSEFVQIGSAMGEAYADILLGAGSTGHAYVYHPSARLNKRCPVIVFLHGWLGNMKPYVWSWARLADRCGFVIVCPTFGNGLWKGESADDTLRWLDRVIREDPMCDARQVFVVGLSNGGTGVTRWATVLPETYRGLVMVSPVMEDTDLPEFVSAVGSRPILVVHGGNDNRIPPSYVEASVARMKARGLQVRSICYADEDHILVLSSRERLQSDLLAWMSEQDRAPTTAPHSEPAARTPQG